jgi:alpha-mannosidase
MSASVDAVLAALDSKHWKDLFAAFPLTWRRSPTEPADPLAAVPGADWAVWDGAKPSYRLHGKNWFYADLAFPESHCGIPLAGTIARIFINGYCPFTLWIDGIECYRETHAWNATGPIADPFPVPIVPGRVHRLIACFEPTDLPALANDYPGAIQVRSAPCMDLMVDVGAASFELRLAQGFARSADEQRLIGEAAARIDLAALAENRWPAVLASIHEMETVLAPFAARAKAMTVHLVGHTHIDMDWMWTWKDTVHCVRRDATAVTDLMDDFPEVGFVHSQVPTYQVIQEQDPAVFARIKRFVAEGRWQNAASTWVEGDLNMADGESIARHMQYAHDWSVANLGQAATVMWAPDTFGHPGNMPQLARLGGMDSYFHWRCNPGRDDNWPIRVWEGVDGTPIIAFSGAYGGWADPLALQGSALASQRHGLSHALHVWGLGDHGGGLPRFMLAQIERFRNRPLIPRIVFDTMAGTLAAIRPEVDRLKRNRGETFTLFEGCFTTHASIKRYNRRCEGALLAAEALAARAGLDRRDTLRGAWTDTLFNQFHDSFDGAAVQGSYVDAHARAEKSLATAGAVAAEALAALVRPDPAGVILTVVNTLGHERSEPMVVDLPAGSAALADADGRILPVQPLDGRFVVLIDRLPAFTRRSYRILDRLPADFAAPAVAVVEQGEEFRIDTRLAAIRLHRGSGAIGSYVDKGLCQEFVAYGVDKTLTHVPCTRRDLALNVFQIIDESPNTMSAWLINDILKEESLLRGATVTLVETGPVFARFRVRHAFRASTISEDVIIYQDFPRIDCIADIDWRERGDDTVGVPQLKVSFGSGLRAARLRCEGPFTVVERDADGTDQPTQKWADLSGDEAGFALLNDSKYGVDALGGRLRLTLLRNPYNPDRETDNGRHLVRFAFLPHGPGLPAAELVRAGMAFNRPPVAACSGGADEDAFLDLAGAPDVVCTALRRAEHSDRLLVRLFETAGRPARLTVGLAGGITAAEEVDFSEQPTGGAVGLAGSRATVDLRPFEVKTLSLASRQLPG